MEPKCDVCLEPIDSGERNYQSTEDSVVCEACCRKLIERAKESRRASEELKAEVIPAGGVERFLRDSETIGG